MVFSKIKSIILAVALIAALVSVAVPAKVFAAASKCWVHSIAGNSDVKNCADFDNLTANQKLLLSTPDKCYDVNFGSSNTPDIQEMACNVPPFNTASTSSPKFVVNDCNGVNIRPGAPPGSNEHCGILDYLQIGINVLAGLVGVVVVAMIIVGGIQYSSAGDDPQKVAAAKSRISNALLALVVFIFMYSFLQWLVPGGIF